MEPSAKCHGSPFCSVGYRLCYGQNYVEQGIPQYELKFKLQQIKWLKKEAKLLNLRSRIATLHHWFPESRLSASCRNASEHNDPDHSCMTRLIEGTTWRLMS
jgi:hypothetical protein